MERRGSSCPNHPKAPESQEKENHAFKELLKCGVNSEPSSRQLQCPPPGITRLGVPHPGRHRSKSSTLAEEGKGVFVLKALRNDQDLEDPAGRAPEGPPQGLGFSAWGTSGMIRGCWRGTGLANNYRWEGSLGRICQAPIHPLFGSLAFLLAHKPEWDCQGVGTVSSGSATDRLGDAGQVNYLL